MILIDENIVGKYEFVFVICYVCRRVVFVLIKKIWMFVVVCFWFFEKFYLVIFILLLRKEGKEKYDKCMMFMLVLRVI